MVVPLRNDVHTALWGWITTGRTHGNCRQMGRYHAGPRDCLSSKSDGVSVRVWGGVEETDRVRPVSSKLPRLYGGDRPVQMHEAGRWPRRSSR